MSKNCPDINCDNYEPSITEKPYVQPLVGIMVGIFIWILDAAVDVGILGKEQNILENIFFPEISDLWMRSLITFAFLVMGLSARKSIIKHIELDKILLNHKKELEILVAQRTKELQIKTEEMIILANQDPLTGLANRRKFNEILHQEYNRYIRCKVPFCLIMIDIDNFKRINDNYGHDIGDEVIVNFSKLVSNQIRKTDVIARWGGEEFSIIAIETTDDSVRSLTEKIRNVINSVQHNKVGSVTASIGVTCSKDKNSLETIIKHADDALFQAKNNGRDRIEYL